METIILKGRMLIDELRSRVGAVSICQEIVNTNIDKLTAFLRDALPTAHQVPTISIVDTINESIPTGYIATCAYLSVISTITKPEMVLVVPLISPKS